MWEACYFHYSSILRKYKQAINLCQLSLADQPVLKYKMRAIQEEHSSTEQATEDPRHQNPGPQKDLIVSKVDSTADEPQDGRLSPNYFSYDAFEPYNMVACDNTEASNYLSGLKKLTKAQLRTFLASDEMAASIVQELADLKAARAAQSLSEEDLVRLMIANPVLGETFALVAKEALENYKILCKDSYMQALRDVEKDNQAWLQAQRHFKGIEGMEDRMGRSPAQEALQSPHDWPVPAIPCSSLEAIRATGEEADAAKARLRSAAKRKVDDWMDQVCYVFRTSEPVCGAKWLKVSRTMSRSV